MSVPLRRLRETPRHLLVCEKSHVRHERSRHAAHVRSHAYNCRVSAGRLVAVGVRGGGSLSASERDPLTAWLGVSLSAPLPGACQGPSAYPRCLALGYKRAPVSWRRLRHPFASGVATAVLPHLRHRDCRAGDQHYKCGPTLGSSPVQPAQSGSRASLCQQKQPGVLGAA